MKGPARDDLGGIPELPPDAATAYALGGWGGLADFRACVPPGKYRCPAEPLWSINFKKVALPYVHPVSCEMCRGQGWITVAVGYGWLDQREVGP